MQKSDVSDYWYERGWSEIRSDIVRSCGHLLHKVRLSINGYEIPNDFSIYAVRDYSVILRATVFAVGVFFPFGLLLPLAAVGILLSIRDWKRFMSHYLLLLAYGATLVIFFVNARFREPLIPVLILFAVYGGNRIWQCIRAQNWRLLFGALVLLVLTGVESNSYRLEISQDRLRAYDFAQLAKADGIKGDIHNAILNYRRALELFPNYADAANSLGYLLVQQKKLPEASDLFRNAIAMDFANILGHLNYAATLADLGQIDSAIIEMRNAIRMLPPNDTLHAQLGFFLARKGEELEAITELEEALRINPQNSAAKRLLERVRSQ
ncbi:MAG: tetratricopeptide repeat protein [Candidatus Zixiibacteriota bacterium]